MARAIFLVCIFVLAQSALGITYSTVSISTDYNLDPAVDLVYADASAGSLIVTLPSAAASSGKCYKISDSKCATDVNNIMVVPQSGDTIMTWTGGMAVEPQCGIVQVCSNGQTVWMVNSS